MADTPPPISPVTVAFQQAMAKLSAGELGVAIPAFLEIQTQHPESEEALFCQEQLERVRRLWPAESEKAGLTTEAWNSLQTRAAARKAGKAPRGPDFAPIVLLVAVAAWCFALILAPHAAFLGRGPAAVPLIFRIVAFVVGAVSAGTAFGLMKMKWEAVNVFIILSPVFMIVTFIGFTESTDLTGKIVCALALAGEIYAAWYMSKFSHRFIY
jgi:hypothetical protein